MTTPNLRPTVPGCYRCDLREDEARDHASAEWDDITEVRHLRARLAAAEADRDQLIDRLTTAKALHVPQAGQGPAYCQDCDQRWPCPTRAALAATTNTTKEN